MASSTYDPSVRVLECPRCGAPVEGGTGEVRCRFCGATLQVEARDDRPVAARGAALEDERARLLASRPEPPLAGYGAWSLSPTPPDCVGKETSLPYLQSAWAELRAAPQPVAEYRTYWLALMLDAAYGVAHDEPRRRAMLESALELLPGAGCKHVVRCHLAAAAMKAGDADAAERWLAGCDPDAQDDDLAANYVMSSAVVAWARKDWDRALLLIGPRLDAAPTAFLRKSRNCAELRIVTLEDAGRSVEALAQLRAAIAELGPSVLATLASDGRAPLTVARFKKATRRGGVALLMVAAALGFGVWSIVHFSRLAGPPFPASDHRGHVEAITGAPPVGEGAPCTIAVRPANTSSGHNCRVTVACGGLVLYGAAKTTGFSHCTAGSTKDGRSAVSVLGIGDTDATGDPALDLHTATGGAVVTDRRPVVPWSITIRLDGP